MNISGDPVSVEWIAPVDQYAGLVVAMSSAACSGVVMRGSASARSPALFTSSAAIVSSELTTTRIISRPSSDMPIVNTLDPRRGGGQRAHVRVDLFRVAQDVGRAGDVAEVVERSRHRLAEGEVVDEGGGEEGLGGELADERGVLLVEGLLGGGGERQYGGREGEEGGPEALEQLHRGLP